MTVIIVNLLLIKVHGYPLVIDRESRVVSLPPFLREFPFSSVVAFQWIRSISMHSSAIEGDLNLLIRENGEILRYSVLHDPMRSQIREIVAFSGLAVEEQELDQKANRNLDCNIWRLLHGYDT